jgi:hypothetical protein
MDDAHLAVGLGAGGLDWSWTAFVPVSTPLGNVVVFAQINAEKGRLLPFSINNHNALAELGDTQFALSPRENSAAGWTAKGSLSSERCAAPLGLEIDVADLTFQRQQRGDSIYFRMVYRGISFPGYTNGVWLADENGRSRRHGYTPLRLLDRDVVSSEISKIGDDPDEWYVGVTVSTPYLSQLELDAIELMIYLLGGTGGIRQCVESDDADARPLSRSFHRVGHAREGDAKRIFSVEQYPKPEFYLDEFPWSEYVQNFAPRPNASRGAGLDLIDVGSGIRSTDVLVRCRYCDRTGRLSSVSSASDSDNEFVRCRGRRPELRIYEPVCPKRARPMLLGASNLWFSLYRNAFALPSRDADVIERDVAELWASFEGIDSRDILAFALRRDPSLARLRDHDLDALWEIVERRRSGPADEDDGTDLRRPEWERFVDPQRWAAKPGLRARRSFGTVLG